MSIEEIVWRNLPPEIQEELAKDELRRMIAIELGEPEPPLSASPAVLDAIIRSLVALT